MTDYVSFSIEVTTPNDPHRAEIESPGDGSVRVRYFAEDVELGRSQVNPDLALITSAAISGLAQRGWLWHRYVFVPIEEQRHR